MLLKGRERGKGQLLGLQEERQNRQEEGGAYSVQPARAAVSWDITRLRLWFPVKTGPDMTQRIVWSGASRREGLWTRRVQRGEYKAVLLFSRCNGLCFKLNALPRAGDCPWCRLLVTQLIIHIKRIQLHIAR